jgi:foldase protein PrsA
MLCSAPVPGAVLLTRMISIPRRFAQTLAAAVAFAALIAVAAGCGSSVPSGAVATVGGNTITKGEFDHWYQTAAKQQAQQTGAAAGPVVAPDPPDFKSCVAAKAAQPVPPGTPKPTPASLKAQCKSQYATLSNSVMQFLITARWLTAEAARRHLNVSDQEVRQSFEQQKAQAFPHAADYQKYLAQSGQTEADILVRVKLQLIQNRLQTTITQSAAPVTAAQMSSYYGKNKQRFSQPETRDLLIVLTSKKPQADAALAAIKSGQSWAAVAKKYSIDTASKAAGGKLPGVTRGQQEQSFDTAIFAAPVGQLEGPVKTQFGYYVFKVTKISPPSQQTLAQATPTIQSLLRSQHEQAALASFIKGFQQRYHDQTVCAKNYTVAQLCSNASAPKSQPVSGSPPQTTPAQTAPQGGVPQGSIPQGGAAPPQSGSGAPPQSGSGAPPQSGSGAPPQSGSGAPPQQTGP